MKKNSRTQELKNSRNPEINAKAQRRQDTEKNWKGYLEKIRTKSGLLCASAPPR